MSAPNTDLPQVNIDELPPLPEGHLPALPDEIRKTIEGLPDLGDASTQLSMFRTRLSVFRTRMSLHRTSLSMYRTNLSKYRTNLSNLRSHLSNERTHLSYLRTSVSLIGFGITINRFGIYLVQNDHAPAGKFLLRDTGNAGLGMVVLGLLLLMWSIYRFWRVSSDIENGKFVSRYRATLIASVGLLLLGGLTALWLFLSGPSP